ncbi:MAG: type I glutamate--ammonia ligase [Legionellaceae bacterium]|nr:type I glutamate--ammonia ligase [Legionellaceae bacterium]
MTDNALLAAIKEHDAKFVDLRFTDPRGKEQHITLPVSAIDDDFMENGKMIDGSSIRGWQKIHQSDLALLPCLDTVLPDPFYQDSTVFVRCDVVDPQTNIGYDRDPRSISRRAEAWLQSTGIADQALFGPEPEFFLFDDARWETKMQGSYYQLDSEEAQWNSGKVYPGGNIGHRPSIKGGYFPVPPVDSSQDIRSAMCLTLEALGIPTEAHHHEVATGNQCEIATRFNTLTKKADELQIIKYVIHNVAHNYGKTATFMPKPLIGDNGNGMHCHQSLVKDGVNLFSGDRYAGLSETALHYIGGIIHHARALNAFTNPTTVSYKRLVPGFEAPVLLAYSARNRSASIRIPHVANPKGRRIEVRFPDPMANPYLAFSAMMMAGVDGIMNKINPGDAIDKDLYDLPPEELMNVPTVAASLEEAVAALKADQDFLTQGNVFSPDFIASYIAVREEEIQQVRSWVHPIEFQLYYSL